MPLPRLSGDWSFLRSRVARRIVLLFVLCALLPVAALAGLSFSHVTGQLSQQAHKRLRQESKAMGMAMYERLLLLQAELAVIGAKQQQPSASPVEESLPDLDDQLRRRFLTLAVMKQGEKPRMLFGQIESVPSLTPAQGDHAALNRTVVLVESRPGSGARIFMQRRFAANEAGPIVLLGEIDTSYLWGVGGEVLLPAMTDLCVLSSEFAPLMCTRDVPPSMMTQVASRVTQSQVSGFEWQDSGETYLAGYWTIPLKYQFAIPGWTVVLSEPKGFVLAPLEVFTRNFSFIVVLSLLVVALLSVSQIRKTLVPLEQLRLGTRRIAQRDFSATMRVASGDEFEELATSFNAMTAQLARQFAALAAIHEIDRSVLSVLDPSRIVDTVLVGLREVIACDAINVVLTDASEPIQAWAYYRSKGGVDETVMEGVSVSEEDRQMLRGRPDGLRLSGSSIPAWLAPLKRRGIDSFHLVPLLRGEQVLGCIALGYREHTMLGDDETTRLRQLAGQVAVALSNAYDLAERKRAEGLLQQSNTQLVEALAELKSTQKQMVQQERLRALGQMASGVAHDFNNTLSPIVGFSELMLINPRALDDKESLKEHLKIINMAAKDAAKVVSRLREFYRSPDQDVAVGGVDLSRLVEQAVKLSQPKWRDQALGNGVTVQVTTDLQPVPLVAGNESELREVLTNLIFNAVDAIAKSGTITLRTKVEGDGVMLEVSDTGSGMTEEVRQKCLEPFFSTKGEKGTGLGLAMVYGIIRRVDGTIDIQSQPGVGTTFMLRFPVYEQQAPVQTEGDGEAVLAPLHVLVVDDDPLVGRVTSEYLKAAGHTVETVGSGTEAMRLFNPDRFDLVVTDQGMPEMSGEQLAGIMKQIAPATAIILATGVGRTDEGIPNEGHHIDYTLIKPLTMAALQRALRKIKIGRRGGKMGSEEATKAA